MSPVTGESVATGVELPDPANIVASVSSDNEGSVSEDDYPAADNYKICGGINFCDDDRACAECKSDDFECKSDDNPFYYQCIPKDDDDGNDADDEEESPEEEDTVASTSDPDDSGMEMPDSTDIAASVSSVSTPEDYPAVDDYGTCGGISNHACDEDKACAECKSDDFECKSDDNPFYYQCIPKVDDDGNDDDNEEESPEAENTAALNSNAEEVEEEAEEEADEEEADEEEAGITEEPSAENTMEPFTIPEDSEGLAKTTRYFDGCKASCAWSGNVGETVSGPVTTCSNEFEDGAQVVNEDPDLKNVCGGGGNEPAEGGSVAYECVDRVPFTDDSSQRYAFAAANSRCCECYELTFLDKSVDGEGNVCEGCSSYDGSLAGETVIIQVINTGGDLGPLQFDLQIPGGGFGIFNGVAGNESPNGPALFPDSDEAAWDERYGGVSEREQCYDLPPPVVDGCLWRFDSLGNADNPGVSYKRVKCGKFPKLYEKSGCLLKEDTI